jgi:hypothetical protein
MLPVHRRRIVCAMSADVASASERPTGPTNIGTNTECLPHSPVAGQATLSDTRIAVSRFAPGCLQPLSNLTGAGMALGHPSVLIRLLRSV